MCAWQQPEYIMPFCWSSSLWSVVVERSVALVAQTAFTAPFSAPFIIIFERCLHQTVYHYNYILSSSLWTHHKSSNRSNQCKTQTSIQPATSTNYRLERCASVERANRAADSYRNRSSRGRGENRTRRSGAIGKCNRSGCQHHHRGTSNDMMSPVTCRRWRAVRTSLQWDKPTLIHIEVTVR